VVIPTYSVERNDRKQEDIHHAVRQCLLEADKQNATSIAFPLLGSGRFGYPDDIIVESMMKEIKNYLLQNGTSTFLRRITVCDIESDLTILLPESIAEDFSLPAGKIIFNNKLSSLCFF
jgi:O-acetyl-ADP-ribose deacetylase (regulator of RNase III)